MQEPCGVTRLRLDPTRLGVLAVLFFGVLVPGYGQETLRDLVGNVEDAQHEPLRGAVVYLENDVTHAVVTYITDRSGRFSFKRIKGDVDYDVWAIFRDHESKRKTLSQFNTHSDPSITLTIKPE